VWDFNSPFESAILLQKEHKQPRASNHGAECQLRNEKRMAFTWRLVVMHIHDDSSPTIINCSLKNKRWAGIGNHKGGDVKGSPRFLVFLATPKQ
jgi:hypothetical protein